MGSILEKKFNRSQSVPLCTAAQHSADSWSRSWNGWLWWV